MQTSWRKRKTLEKKWLTIQIDDDINNSSTLSIYISFANKKRTNVICCELEFEWAQRVWFWWKIAWNWTQLSVDEIFEKFVEPLFALPNASSLSNDVSEHQWILFSLYLSLIFFIFIWGEEENRRGKIPTSKSSISIFYEGEKQAANEGNKKCMLKISQNMSSYLCFLTGIFSQKDFRNNFFPLLAFCFGG